MKRYHHTIVGLLISLTIYASLVAPSARGGATALAATEPPPANQAQTDPEPPVEPPPLGYVPEPEGITAVLEPAWTAPVADSTNSLAWGDYDLDGDLDLLLGNNGDNRIYENLGGTLTQTLALRCQPGLADNTYGVDWFDYDQDGDLDFAVGNLDGQNCVYRYNRGSGTFTRAWLADEVQNTRSVAWAGWNLGAEFATYLAVGNADEPSVVYKYETGLISPWWTQPVGEYGTANSVAWGDYDNDGDPDLAIGNFGQGSQIYRNDGDDLSLFTTTSISYTRDVAWGDLNGDGYLDLALGNGKTTGRTDKDQVYCNSGSPDYLFTPCWTSADASPTYSIAWGDYEGDGDIDLAASSDVGGVTRIYVNTGGMLGASAVWDADDDLLNSRAVAWADWDGDGDLELIIGYYGVASVLYNNTNGTIVPMGVGDNLLDTRSVAWGDWDGDGDLDLAVGNSNNTPSEIYENNGVGFTLTWTSPFGENTRSVAWGDFDGDGDLDLAAGNGLIGSGFTNRVYENTGETLVWYPGFIDGYDFDVEDTYAVAWGDYDGDQDLDLAAGNYGVGQSNRIYINRGGIFTETIALTPAGDRTLSLAWGDFDQDFDLDLVTGSLNGPNRVYVNQGSGVFTSIALPEPASPCVRNTRSVAWADWDGDGDLDIAAGNASTTSGCVQVIAASEAGGNWTFTTAWQSASLDVRSVAWGDHDGDGDDDLALGISGQFGGRSRIYRNVGGSMVEFWLAPASESDPATQVAWGDYDADGDLDLTLATGLDPDTPNRVYTNHWISPANVANDPTHVDITRPDDTDEAWFFSSYDIIGHPVIFIPFTLYDDEYDPVFLMEPQVSWDGGGHWEPAWDSGWGSGVTNLSTGPEGDEHAFGWDALYQLLDHQNIPFDPDQGIYVPFPQSDEEIDVAFRMVVWANNDHGGPILKPVFSSATTIFRIDMRPDWSISAKTVETDYAIPGEPLEFTIAITQTDHGMPPDAYVLDFLPPELTIGEDDIVWATTGDVTWTQSVISWTGALAHEQELWMYFDPMVTRPLTDDLELENCAEIYDGLHAPFERCTTFVISSTPILDESWKWVNGLPYNEAMPGDVLTYTLVLTNTGTDNARDMLVTDTLDSHLVWLDLLSASSGAAAYTDGMILWEGRVNVFEPVTITYQVALAPTPGGTLITNTAWISDGVNAPFFLTPVTTTVIAPDMRASMKTGTPAVVELGDVISYTIVLENHGVVDADPATLTDPIPEGSAYISGTFQTSEGIGGYNPVTEAITWTGKVDIGASITMTFAITAGMPSQPPAPILTNTAIFTDPIGGWVNLVATTTVILPDMRPSFKQATPGPIELGDRITYTIMLSNTGGYGPGTELEDFIPPSATYVPDSFVASGGSWLFDSGIDLLRWWGDLHSGDSVTMTFAITAGCPATVTSSVVENIATLFDAVDFELPLRAETSMDLPNLSASTFTADKTLLEAGDLLEYTVVIRNSGGYAPYAWLEDFLPQDVIWTGVYSASRGQLTYLPAVHQVRWDGEIHRDEIITIRFQVQVSEAIQSDQIDNYVSLSDGCQASTLGPIAIPVLLYFTLFLPIIAK